MFYGETNDEFEKLLGKELKFYGVDNLSFKVNNLVFEVLEDEEDGYRSSLGAVRFDGDWKKFGLIFHRRAFARVRVEEYDDGYMEGYCLVDVDDGHQWLRFGTENYDDYYPMFAFHYQAKPA